MIRWRLMTRAMAGCGLLLGWAVAAQADGFGPMGMMNPWNWMNGNNTGGYYPPPPAYGYPVVPPGYTPYPPTVYPQTAPAYPAATPAPRAVQSTVKAAPAPVEKKSAVAQKLPTSAPTQSSADNLPPASVSTPLKEEKKQAPAVIRPHATYNPAAPVFRPLEKK